MYKYKILKISQVIDSEKEFIRKDTEEKLFKYATTKIRNFITDNFKKEKILFICGPGKNGLDGLKTAELLVNNEVLIYLISQEVDPNLKKLGLKISKCNVIVDCIFGIGLNRKLKKKYIKIINKINLSKKIIISIDIPSGFDCNSGLDYGAFIKANYTLAMGFFKPAHFLLPSKKFIGSLNILDLKLDLPKKLKPEINILNKNQFKKFKVFHDIDINKYDKGHVCVFGGKMPGASRIVALASRKIGAGLSTILIEKNNLIYYCNSEPGTIIEKFNFSKLNGKNVFVIGPGLGKTFNTNKLYKLLSSVEQPVILDADAISLFENEKEIFYKLLNKKKNFILTPHYGEFMRVFTYNEKISKIENCLNASKLINNPIIFKGNDTVISFPTGKVYIDNNSSNSLATAGSGDMLCGMIAGLISQGVTIKESILASTFLQGLISQKKNKTIVEDFIELIPGALNLIKKK